MEDFEYAKDKVLMGSERKSMIISEEEKRITAYHEAGHALIAALEKEADPLHKVSIIPRGMALGVTQQLPLNDKYTYSKTYLDAQLVGAAGRTHFRGDLPQHAHHRRRQRLREGHLHRPQDGLRMGHVDLLGPLTFGRKEDMIFLGRDLMSHNEYSEETSQQIDIGDQEDHRPRPTANSKKIILENRDKLEIIALQLLEKESLTSDDIAAILGTPKKTRSRCSRRNASPARATASRKPANR